MTLVLPYAPHIVGDPQTGVIHGGAITSLMDTACGMATLCVLPEFEVCPTLDLRIDYMHPAEPHKPVFGFAQCYRVTTDVIFTRGFATRTIRSNRLPTWWARSCAWASASRAARAWAMQSRENRHDPSIQDPSAASPRARQL